MMLSEGFASRGFEEYYSIPAENRDWVAGGHWEKGPGIELFNKIRERLGDCVYSGAILIVTTV